MTEEGTFVVSTAPVTLDGDVMNDVMAKLLGFAGCLEETSLDR